jgi:hypothetical protein
VRCISNLLHEYADIGSHALLPVKLFSRNKEVDETNIRELAVLKGTVAVFEAVDEVRFLPSLKFIV